MELQLEILRSRQAADPFAFQVGRQDYILRLPLGGVESVTLDWDEALLGELRALGQSQRDPVLIQRIGERLRRFLATPSFAQSERALLSAVARTEPVFVTLRLAAAELFALPWELLALSGSGLLLGALPGVLLRYAWPQTATEKSRKTQDESGRVLLAWSASAGSVPAAEHEAALRRACERAQIPFDPALDVLPHVTRSKLERWLTERSSRSGVAILHLLCHGVRDGQTFGLAFDSDDGGRDTVDAATLRQLLSRFAPEISLVVVAACDGGNPGELGNHLGSVAQALHRAGIATVLASRYPLSVTGSIALFDELYGSLLGEPCSLEQAVVRARQRLWLDASGLDWASVQLYARPEDGHDSRPVLIRPYRGLSPFLPGQRRFLFGRDAERSQARQMLSSLTTEHKPRFLLVTGASGTGKSSVVLGGLLPDLLSSHAAENAATMTSPSSVALLDMLRRVRRDWPTLSTAIDGLLRELGSLSPLVAESQWEALVMRPGSTPLATLSSVLAARKHPDRPLLLVVDQLEELFTHCDDGAVRSAFVKTLWSLSQSDEGVSCVVTLRVDFLGRCGELLLSDEGLRLDRIAYSDAHRLFVAQPGTDQLAAAIAGPAQLVGLEISPSLRDRIVAEVQGEPGALPLLSYVLDLLWLYRDGNRLSEQVYSELGGVAGALGQSADRVYFGLSAADQRLARRLLLRLVGFAAESGGETRRRVTLRTLQQEVPDPDERLSAVLTTFVQARLLVRSDEAGQPVVEFAHEALIRRWQRLQDFLQHDRQRILELRELQQWTTQCESFGTLLRGAQLGYAERLLEKYPDELGTQVSRLVRRSLWAQRRRWLSLSLSIGLVVAALVFLTLAERRSEQRAVAEQKLAVAKEQTAQARLLAMHAEQLPDTASDTALLYATRAMQLHPEHSTRSALLSALRRSALIRHFVRTGSGRAHSVGFSQDSRWLVAAMGEAGLWLFDVTQGRLLGPRLASPGSCPSCPSPALYAATMSPDGTEIAATGQGGQIYLWQTRDFAASAVAPRTIATTARALYSLDFAPDGSTLAAGTGDGQVIRVALRKAESATSSLVEGSSQIVAAVAFEPGTGKRLAVAENGGSGGSVSIFDAASGQRRLGPLVGGHGYVSSLAWSPSGHLLVAASEDRRVLMWDADSGQPQRLATERVQPQGALSAVSFSADGRWLASCGLDGAIHLWDVDRLRMLDEPLRAPSGALYSCALSPSGRLLASGSDGMILIWDLTAHPSLHKLWLPLSVSALTTTPDGKAAVVADRDGSVRLVDLTRSSDAAPQRPQPAHSRAVHALTTSLDGSLLASGGADGSVGIFALPDLLRRRTFWTTGHGAVMTVALGPQGDTVAAGFADGNLAIYSLPSGLRLHLLATKQQSLTALTFDPSGRILWSGGLDGSIRSQSALSGERLCPTGPRIVHTDSVTSLAVSPALRVLASGGRDRVILLSRWDDQTGCLLPTEKTILEASAGVTQLAFGSDGRLLASGSDDGNVQLWDAVEKKPVGGPLGGPRRAITGLGFAGDGLLLAGDGETLWTWDIRIARWMDMACARAGHNLSLVEWQTGLGDSPYCKVCSQYQAGPGADPKSPVCQLDVNQHNALNMNQIISAKVK